jgi:arginine decarboxylase
LTPKTTDQQLSLREPTERWTTTEAAEMYDVAAWGKGYFAVGKNGNLWVHPDKREDRKLDLMELVEKLELRGISLPILIRFGQILQHRMGEMRDAFANAITEHGYKSPYYCVFPIKVNQQRQVVEEVYRYGREFGFGLEAGSKPELLAVMAITPTMKRRSCATASKTMNTSSSACSPKRSAARSFRSSKNTANSI